MTAPAGIIERVELFRRNYRDYTTPDYKETELRHHFLDPLFEALGWDVNNTRGYAETYRDVIHEDALKVGGATKAPDYAFRIGGARKFFVEAKKPSVNIREDREAAFQLRRYAWSARLPLSILTDFEDLAVYDCRADRGRHDRMVALVERMLGLHRQLAAARTDQEKTVCARQIDATGAQIDALVYELYGITDEERKIVEGEG